MTGSTHRVGAVLGAIAGTLLLAGVGVAALLPLGGSAIAHSSAAQLGAFGAGVGAGRGAAAITAPSTATSSPAASSPGASAAGLPTAVGQGAPPANIPQDTIVRTGTIGVQVAKGGFSDAFSRAAQIANSEGGFVVTADMGTAGPRPTSGTLVVRVPGAKFDDARRQLEGLGRLQNEQLAGQDAGGQLSDLAARIADLQAEQAGLRAMEQKGADPGTLLQIQSELAQVQQQIDGLSAQQNQLQNAVSLASITLSVAEPVVVPAPRSVLDRRAAQAVHGLAAVTGGVLVVVAYAAVPALIGGLVAIPLVLRRRRRVGAVLS